MLDYRDDYGSQKTGGGGDIKFGTGKFPGHVDCILFIQLLRVQDF